MSDLRTLTLGAGCFWCLDAVYQRTTGVREVISGYTGGHTDDPGYREVCSGMTGHAEALQVTFDADIVPEEVILGLFFTGHDPTSLNRQGYDVGTQYRSAIYTTDPSQVAAVEATRAAFGERLAAKGYGEITTEVAELGEFYYAEDYHQQYLAKVPNGYCGLGGTGVSCPIGLKA